MPAVEYPPIWVGVVMLRKMTVHFLLELQRGDLRGYRSILGAMSAVLAEKLKNGTRDEHLVRVPQPTPQIPPMSPLASRESPAQVWLHVRIYRLSLEKAQKLIQWDFACYCGCWPAQQLDE
jgi:hypothetical protein